MSSRCKACNNKLTDRELTKRVLSLDKKRVEYAELCTQCLNAGDYTLFKFKDSIIPDEEIEE